MAVGDAPIIIKRIKKGGERRPPRRRLEGGLRRLRHRHDGLLPADVADQHHLARAEEAASPTISPRPASRRPPRARAASWAARRWATTAPGRTARARSSSRLAPEAPRETTDAGPAIRSQANLDDAVASRRCARRCRSKEEAAFQSAAASLKQALQDMPELAELSKQILIDQTPEGLRIQLIDQEGRSMFNQGQAQPNDRARILLRAVAKVINQLPNRVTIAGHTSASAGGGQSRRATGRCRRPAPTPRARSCRAPASTPTGSTRSPARPAPTRCIPDDPTLRRQPPHRHRAAARGAGAAARTRPCA